MGARNVAAAFAMWGHLDHGPFRLLVGMALVALDTPTKEGRPARVYFGGEQGMVDLYGREGSAVYNALSALRKARAVEVMEKGRNGHRAVYKLNLDPFPGGPKASSQVSQDEQPWAGKASREMTPKPHVSGNEASREPKRSLTQTGPLGTTRGSTRKSPLGETSTPEVPHQGVTTPGDDEIDYSTAYKIVEAALGIERASARIRELTADGTNYTAAMLTLAHQVEEARRPTRSAR